jgi:hypothetical protein
MDLWQMVRADYANIRELCREVLQASAGGRNSRASLFAELDVELERHMRAKERVLYPVLERDDRTRGYLPELRREQQEIRRRMDGLAAMRDKSGRRWAYEFKDLVSYVSHLFTLEEGGVMTMARAVVDPQEHETLRRAYEREKIASIEARRWHVPEGLVPARYGLSNGAVVGVLAGVAAVGAAAYLWQRLGGSPIWARRRGFRRYGQPMNVAGAGNHAHEMISTHPQVRGNTNDALIRCIEECYSCAQACTSCADACAGEPMVQQLAQCIRLDLDCANVCAATSSVATRRTGSNEAVIRRMLEACAAACRLCAEECERHAGMHEHCRICAEACRRCEQACKEAFRSMTSGFAGASSAYGRSRSEAGSSAASWR